MYPGVVAGWYVAGVELREGFKGEVGVRSYSGVELGVLCLFGIGRRGKRRTSSIEFLPYSLQAVNHKIRLEIVGCT